MISAAALALIGAGAVMGCGAEERASGVEGGEVDVGGLAYSVQLSRIVSPFDTEDRSYLAGAPPAADGQTYLGVFMRIDNDSGGDRVPTRRYAVVDTRGKRYTAIPSQSAYALEVERLAPGDRLPPPGSPAATGPIDGALLLFRVDESSLENAPLDLEILGSGAEEGRVTLDI